MSLSSGHTQSLCVWPSGQMRVVPAQTFHPPAGDVDSCCKSLENMPGEMATYLQRWTGSSSSSHSRPGGHTGSKLYAHVCGTHLPSPGWEWVGSKLNYAIPALPRVAPRLVIGMNIQWGIYKGLPINNCIHPSHQPGILELPPKRQRSVPAQLSLGSPLPAHSQHVPEAFWKALGGLGQMGMALLPSAVEMLPTHLLWGPSSPRRITVPPTKVALLSLPSFCSTDGHAGAENQIPSPVGVGWTQAGALRVTSLPHHQAKACRIESARGYGEESPYLAWSMRAQ